MSCRFLFYYQCIQLMIIVCIAEFSFQEEVYEGSPCVLEKDEKGICKNITQCPKKLKETRLGLRDINSSDRCGFIGVMEIVCCPLQHFHDKIGLRPADIACHQFENEIPVNDGLVFHIFNGEEANQGEFPSMAALGYRDKENKNTIIYNCGGSLISTLYVLTAAHCMININNQVPVEVQVGSINLDVTTERTQRILIDETYPHPKYKFNAHYYDIALIKLRNPVRLTTTVRPICLQTRRTSKEDSQNSSLIVIGFGATSFDTERSSKLMKTPGLDFVNRTECDKHYKEVRKLPTGIDQNMICSRDSNTTRRSDACQGDSGGPLIVRKKNTQSLIGITSFGSACGSIVPGVYTAVFPFLDWIEMQVWGEEVLVYPEAILSSEGN